MQGAPPQAIPQQTALMIEQKKKYTLMTPTGGEWISSMYVIFGLLCWIIASFLPGNEGICSGLAWMFFFGAVVNAVHCVEKAVRNLESAKF